MKVRRSDFRDEVFRDIAFTKRVVPPEILDAQIMFMNMLAGCDVSGRETDDLTIANT